MSMASSILLVGKPQQIDVPMCERKTIDNCIVMAVFVVFACVVTVTHAQQRPTQLPGNYPNKPIRFIVPYPAGGGGRSNQDLAR